MAKMKFTKIPKDTFEHIQQNAGILLKDFNANMTEDQLYENLIGATSGGITISATPTFSDLGEDIDNCPKNTKELKHLDSWEMLMSGTFVTMSPDSTKFQLAAADIDATSGKITVRNDLDVDKDFMDLWWVGDYNEGNGYIAAHMLNALSTGGLKIKTNDQGKATADFEFTGHYTIEDQDTVPMEFYVVEKISDSTDTDSDEDEEEKAA